MTEIDKVVNKWGNIIVDVIRKKLTSGDKIATGRLVRSVTFFKKNEGQGVSIGLFGASYMGYVDRGRKPGKYVPIKPLIAWIKAKGITPRMARGDKNKEKAIRGLAFAISANIKKRGIKEFPIINIAKVVSNSSQFRRELMEATKIDLIAALKNNVI